MITEKDEMHTKLSKLKKPKLPEGVVDIANPAFFSIRPRDSLKTYYFGVPSNERSLWIGYMNDARDGMNRFREALRLKRGPSATISSSSAVLMGNLQPLNSNINSSNSPGNGASQSGSVSSTASGSSSVVSSSAGPTSHHSFQSNNSMQSSNSGRSNTTNSSEQYARVGTYEGGAMPGTLAQHSASAPPARQVNIITSPSSPSLGPSNPSPNPQDDDPFGMSASKGSQDGAPYQQHSSPSILGSSSQPQAQTASSNYTQSSPSPYGDPNYQYQHQQPQYQNYNYQNQDYNFGQPQNPALQGYSSSPSPMYSSPSNNSHLYSSSPASQGYSSSPAPQGTATLSTLPTPILLSTDHSHIRDSFVFDSAI